MTRFRWMAFTVILLALAFGSVVWAQDDRAEEQEFETVTVDGEEFTPFGDIDLGDWEPFQTEEDDVDSETGALIFVGSTPGDQHPNVDLVGPDGYFQHLEVEDEDGAERVVEGLAPGVYSVAATDDGLQVAHTLVEVRPGQAVRVRASLSEPAEEFAAGAFADDRFDRAAFPADGFVANDPATLEDQEFGRVSVQSNDEDATFVITGPDAYSEEFGGEFTAEGLRPGVYVIAGTGEGSRITTKTLEVEAAVEFRFAPAFERVPTAETAGAEGGVAGAGAAETEEAESETEVVEMEVETDETDDQQQDGAQQEQQDDTEQDY